MQRIAQRILHVAVRVFQVGSAKVVFKQRTDLRACISIDRHRQKARQQIVDRLLRAHATGVAHHLRQVYACRHAGYRFYLLDRLAPCMVAGKAGVEVFVAVILHRHRRYFLVVGLGRSRYILAHRDFLGDWNDAVAIVSNTIRCDEINRREKGVIDEVTAHEQKARRDPASAAGPASHVRRVQQLLAHRLGQHIEVRNARHFGQPQLAIRRDREFDRRLDARADRCFAIEIARYEYRLEKRGDLELLVAQ